MAGHSAFARGLWRLTPLLFGSLMAGAMGACQNDGPVDQGVGGAATFDPSTSGSGGSKDDECARVEKQAVSLPVNLYVMFDRSASMVGGKWDAATEGLKAFISDPYSEGLRVGLRFFPRPVDQTPVCDQKAYAEPLVPFGALPGNAPSLLQAIDMATPEGFSTPMYPALGGAILKGIELAEANPNEVSAVLLVTDGQPQGPASSCGGVDPEDPAEVAKLASIGSTYSPPVATYVIGLPGVDLSSANQIAAAGGTDSAIVVASGDVQKQFREALGKVRGDVLPCQYELPKEVIEGEIDVGSVNVEITPSKGETEVIARNDDCDGSGWLYSDDGASIVLCPDTCESLKADNGAAIRIVLGCATLIK